MREGLMRNVGAFLKDQRGPVWSVHPDQTVREALELLARHNIGALLVLRDAHLEGVFSERDYARKVALEGRSSNDTRIAEVMTTHVIHVSPEHSIEACMELMTNHRIRHLPVLDGDQLIGL
ncbi:MAG: CBS domain-containing protein, partial [Betaproteobacteria bacterium]|nr:CBS domain-containing protein [Betaproteobacteria bacterium]